MEKTKVICASVSILERVWVIGCPCSHGYSGSCDIGKNINHLAYGA